ncbi:DUF6578 domain-containing protein [Arthrobacter psychrochitiniphilus]|uniref:DUF6578 domain-containing protein n=1 Tax=Arthrobacter psychrochitiniphilus TaxID=291045 RepID=UPI003F7B3A32
MQIEVIITGWEQGCCGAPFQVGSPMTWKLQAEDPAQKHADALPRFQEEHHEQTPEDVPQWDVTGVVVAITGINYPSLPITGEPRSFTPDTEHPQDCAISSVGEPAEPDFEQYSVVFEVAEDAELPPYAPEETLRQIEFEAIAEELNHARMHDGVGVVLEALADHAQNSYGTVARITREANRSAVTAEPHNTEATAIRWARSSANDDGILVTVGDGTWLLPATAADADSVGEFLLAAAQGRVAEHVRPGEGKAQYLATEFQGTDGHLWSVKTEFEPFDSGNGVFAVVGTLWERVQRGEHRYQPWER